MATAKALLPNKGHLADPTQYVSGMPSIRRFSVEDVSNSLKRKWVNVGMIGTPAWPARKKILSTLIGQAIVIRRLTQ